MKNNVFFLRSIFKLFILITSYQTQKALRCRTFIFRIPSTIVTLSVKLGRKKFRNVRTDDLHDSINVAPVELLSLNNYNIADFDNVILLPPPLQSNVNIFGYCVAFYLRVHGIAH